MTNKLPQTFSFVAANIADKGQLKQRNIDTIVNAAKPTLMGSNRGVDGAIHQAIDTNQQTGYFRHMICEELKTAKTENLIRCQRGEAVMTSGYKLCNHVIHVVGAEYDGGKGWFKECSSSTINILESCYYNIVKKIKENPDIVNIAIPVISSGEYGFPFETAARIAVSGIYNALIEWRMHDPEMFSLSGLERIYFFVQSSNSDGLSGEYKKQIGNRILEEYKPVMKKGKRIVFQTSSKAHFRYWKEIIAYDEKRGYFSGAKLVRELLMLIRVVFLPVMALKDLIGRRDWEKRRRFVELFAIGKVLTVLLICWLAGIGILDACPVIRNCAFPILFSYCMADTVTYLLTLVVMADIQRPSANIIRSMILLFVNYIEVSLEMSYLFFIYRDLTNRRILFRQAAAFGILGIEAGGGPVRILDYIFVFADYGIKFFFITLVFGYFANHMHQRKFRS